MKQPTTVDPRDMGGPVASKEQQKTPKLQSPITRTNQRDPVDPTGQGQKQPAGKENSSTCGCCKAHKTCRLLPQVSDGNRYFRHVSLQEDSVRTSGWARSHHGGWIASPYIIPCLLSVALGPVLYLCCVRYVCYDLYCKESGQK